MPKRTPTRLLYHDHTQLSIQDIGTLAHHLAPRTHIDILAAHSKTLTPRFAGLPASMYSSLHECIYMAAGFSLLPTACAVTPTAPQDRAARAKTCNMAARSSCLHEVYMQYGCGFVFHFYHRLHGNAHSSPGSRRTLKLHMHDRRRIKYVHSPHWAHISRRGRHTPGYSNVAFAISKGIEKGH